MNSRKNIEKRNEVYFRDTLKISKLHFFKKLANAGKPMGFGDNEWSEENPTAGRCGSVINALRLSSKIPPNYIACGQKEVTGGSHYYLINLDSGEVIDPTYYQMKKEYKYENHHQKFLPQLSKNVIDTMKALDLEIDKSKFKIKKDKRGRRYICKP